jgi:hypothetical protein
MSKEEIKVIDITPTWEAVLPLMINIIENGKAEGRKDMIDELGKMARCADLYNKMIKEEKE